MIIEKTKSLAVTYIEQIRIIMSKTVFNPDFIISPNQLGSQLKTSENLNRNQPVVLEAKLEHPLREFESLRCFQVWLKVQQEVLAMAKNKTYNFSLGGKQIIKQSWW